ncbi:MAG TPA: glycoside hydrolase family 44 protein [Roseiflexaceae bacterium]|nr:glycoside hydrolase family 44 protein [Roseiflexaceae bacterium]
MTQIRFNAATALLVAALLVGCAPGPPQSAAPTPSIAAALRPQEQPTGAAAPKPAPDARVTISTAGATPISPLIYGMSGAPPAVQEAVRPTLASWGGNPSTRYNWRLGNAWNAARDWEYRNTDYANPPTAADDFVAEALAGGAEVRLALPALGWVAANSDRERCSFPLPGGGCGDADGADCTRPGPVADPARTSVRTDVDAAVAWVRHLRERGLRVRFFAIDNEPELWGITHYDVHPTCTTYAEIRDTYLRYASAVRAAAPEAELLGPVTCCWHFYWNSAAGEDDKRANGGQDFLPWFLQQVRAHDERAGVRTLDVLDIHYYPEGLYNDKTDPDTAAHRLRSTRSLWDERYVDESWIGEPVALIPRMRALIDAYYPGTKLGISEWNWGGDQHISGALAIAEVLGIFGREGVYLASYWRSPPPDSPGMFAFQLYGNYDGQGGRFGDQSLPTEVDGSGDLGVFASRETTTGRLKVMFINKSPSRKLFVETMLDRKLLQNPAKLYRYSASFPQGISRAEADLGQGGLALPPSSISLLVIEGAR